MERQAQESLTRVIEAVRCRSEGEAADEKKWLEALDALHDLREQLAVWEPLLIEAAREAGASWARIAPALGVTSRQAAERRYLRLRPNKDAALTREQRVQATRDERAGDKAVALWARQNASELRQIAGQVSALTGLSRTGRRNAAALADSLTGDDPSTLIEPLADMHEHLVGDHGQLAARVDAVGRRVSRVRQDTRRQRGADKS
ncbi:MAG TPA: hypothetical protein VLB29_05555 [Nocardioidaceae bacterium]|nr:hypothetical protein [Nocardioidaceae bacterium]